jgi:fibronectin-binding autotransporter adhesin
MSMKRIFALLPLLCVLASAPALAQVKISQLPTAAIPLGDEYVPVVQGGVTSAAPASAFGVPIVSATAPVTNLVTGRHWMNSSTTPYTLEIYDGFEWVPEGSLNPSTHTYGTSVFGCTSPALACLNALTGYNYAGTTGGTTGNIVGSASPSFSGTVAVQNITATGVILASSAALQTGSALDNIEALGMTTGTSAIAVGRFSNNSSGPRFNLMKSRNTSVAIGGAVQAGDSLGLLQFIGDDGSTAGGIVAAQINGEALGTVSTGIVPSGLLFSTLNNAGTLTQAFELDNNQNATFAGAINAVGQQTAQGLTTTSPGWYAQLTGDSMARLRLGLNSTDVASIAFGSGSTSSDTFLERAGAANIRSGAPDAAAPVAQTYSVQNAVSGTSNAAGALWSFYDSAGTGNQPSGGFAWYTHPAGYAGSSQNAATLAMALSGAGTLTIGGSQVPTVGGANTFSGTDNFTGTLQVGGHTVGLAGNLSTSGGFGINLTASGATVVTLPTTGTLAALGNAQTWTALQTITNSDLCLLGSSTGCTTFTSANASATNYTLTFPASTATLADLAGTQTLTNKTISGASNTISNVSLTAGVTGTLPVANGGTNAGGASITALNNITGWLLSGLSGVNSGYLIDTTTASPAQGDTAYFNGTGWADLPAGTSGQSLQTQGASANPHWASNISGYSGTLMVTTAAGVTNYFGMQGDTPSAQTVASDVTTMMDRNGTFGAVGASGKFTCTVGTAPGTGFSDVCGIYSALIPGASAITCTIANTAVTCSDTSDTLTVAAAGLYAFYITPGAGATSTARTYESVSFASP